MARHHVRNAFLTSVTTLLLLATACGGGGGGGASGPVEAPVVREFSPWVSVVAPDTGAQMPTYTNAGLRVSTDIRYGGRVVVYCQGETDIDPASLFVGGNPTLGPSPSSLSLQREIPGVGNVIVPVRVTLDDAAGTGTRNAIVCQPLPPFATSVGDLDGDGREDYATNLPEGQYTIGVFDQVRSVGGQALRNGPVFHTFTVGEEDVIAPRVSTSSPVNGQRGVGAGTPPPPPPPGVPEDDIAQVTTNIFGASSPDIVIRFTESIAASSITLTTVQVVDAGAFVPGGAPPPALIPAPGFPRLRSISDGDTLPSNGHELIWRVDPRTGGFPFGTQVQVTLKGAWVDEASQLANPTTPDNAQPLRDLAGNALPFDTTITFQTVGLPDTPQNPFPEYAIWWSAADRVGAIDTLNQPDLGRQALGLATFPFGVARNVVPTFTDSIANAANIPDFDPLEINIDGRTNPATCHTWVYVQSHNSGQVAVLHSSTGVPVALIDSPSPGGIGVQVGKGAENVLLVTNSGANTFTAFDIGLQTPGTRFLNGPMRILKVQPTGNTPQAIAITSWALADGNESWNRDGAWSGPNTSVIMYADYADGVVSTIRMADNEPVRRFTMGPASAPNDVCFSPCFNPANPQMYAAISQGGDSGQGKVAYWLAGPGCQTGSQSTTRPDAIVGELSGFDGPDGLDENLQSGTDVFFTVAESGADANAVSTLGLAVGSVNQPRLINRFLNVGDTPTKVAHRASWSPPGCIAPVGSAGCALPGMRSCWFGPSEQALGLADGSMVPTKDLYICARGASQVTVIDLTSGSRNFYSPIAIPGVRFVAGEATQ